MGILASSAFEVQSKYHHTKGESPVQLAFGRDMIIQINHILDWRYMRHLKQVQIEKDLIRKNSNIIDHHYRVGYQVIIQSKRAFKYETPFRGPYEHFQMWTNVTVTLRTGAVTTGVNIHQIKPYKILQKKQMYSTILKINKYITLHIYIYI